MNTSRIAALFAAPVLIFGMSACDLASSDTAGGGHHHKSSGNNTGSNSKSPKPKPTPHYTTGQQNAIRSAQQYLSMGTGFSQAGLTQQLSSQAGEGFPMAEAVFAVNHIKVDWNQQAYLSGKAYLSMSGFSRAGLIQQLTSKAGEGFTLAQATYAANKLHLH